MRFTRYEAIEICKRVLHDNPYRVHTGYDCYYHDGKCELGYHCWERCPSYVPDIPVTNKVRKAIVENPKWVIDNWDRICKADKDLFLAIYDKKEKLI